MKKYLLAAIAASLVSAPAMAAPPKDHHYDRGHHYGWDKNHHENRREWHRGDRFDYRYAPNYRVIDYRHYHGLRQPPRGYHWVRSGDDAVLVAITSGVIAAIVADAVAH